MQAFENQNIPKPLMLTLKQQEVLNALRDKETEEYPLSKWYHGALYALENHHNPDRVAQAAHSLRELLQKLPEVVPESSVRVVGSGDSKKSKFINMRNKIDNLLSKSKERYPEGWKGNKIDKHLAKALTEIEEYLELNQQPNRGERVQQAIASIDPMYKQLHSGIQEVKREKLLKLWKRLENFTHHNINLEVTEFKACLDELEIIVFDLLAPITAQDQQEIQTILNYSNKSESTLNRMFSLIERRGSNFAFFFKQVSENADVTWLPFLEKRGYFAFPPNVQITDDNSIICPFWWPIRYLEKISSQASNEVIEIVRQLPQTDNPRVYEGILDIAVQLHGEHSVKLKPKMLEYVLLEHFRLPHRFADLLAHWTKSNQTSAVLELAEILIAFAPDPRSREKRKQRLDNADDWREMIGTTLYPAPKCRPWEYSNIMSKGIRPLTEKEPYKVACLLIDTTVNMIHLRLHQEDLKKGEDFSESWCPRLREEDSDDGLPERILVDTLTFACKKVFEKSLQTVEKLDKMLRKQQWKIFTRLRHHLYARYPNEKTKPWIRQTILTHEDYNEWEHSYEFQQMIRCACEHFSETLLSESERSHIFNAILDGPSKENYRHLVVDCFGEEFTEELFQEHKQHFHRMQFRPFESVLFGKYETRFKKIQEKINKPISDEDYPPYKNEVKSGGLSVRSPRNPEDLSNSTDEKLLAFINDWEKIYEYFKDDSFVRINIEELANTFQNVFKETIIPDPIRLKFWMKNRKRIKRPIYVRMMIYAMQAHVKGRNFDQLNKWLAFSEWVLSHPDRENDRNYRQGDESRETKNWTNARRAVGDFIGICLSKDIDVPITVRGQLARIVETLCTQYDWNLDENHLNGLYRKDPLTEGINNTRSRALEDLIKFGFWLWRHKPECEVPEVTTLLEKRFSSETDYPLTPAEYAILGKNYLSIYRLNEKWAIAHKSDFFPHAQSKRQEWSAAFSSFILCNGAVKQIFEFIKDDFKFALQHLFEFKKHDLIARQPIDVFGERLFNYYLWEMFPLKGQESLLEKFYQQTDKKRGHWANLFKDIGHRLSSIGKHLDPNMKERVKKFFNWRFEQKEPSELKYFTVWLQAECLDVEWRLNAYSKVLDVCQVEDWGLHFKTLCEMLPDHTPKVIECFLKLTKVKKDNVYILLEEAKTILDAGLNSTDERAHQQAVQARDNLLREGRFDLLDLEK